jgi:hypothetical protein
MALSKCPPFKNTLVMAMIFENGGCEKNMTTIHGKNVFEVIGSSGNMDTYPKGSCNISIFSLF